MGSPEFLVHIYRRYYMHMMKDLVLPIFEIFTVGTYLQALLPNLMLQEGPASDSTESYGSALPLGESKLGWQNFNN